MEAIPNPSMMRPTDVAITNAMIMEDSAGVCCCGVMVCGGVICGSVVKYSDWKRIVMVE